MKRMRQMLCVMLCLVMGQWAMSQVRQADNMVVNSDLSDVKNGDVRGWQVVHQSPQVAAGVAGEGNNRSLYLRRDSAGPDEHVWWSQKMPVSGGESLRIQFEARAWGEGDYYGYAGVELYDGAGKWLGFIQSKTVARSNKKYPQSAVAAVKDWRAFSDEVTVSPEARTIALRLALNADSKSHAGFRNISVHRTSVTVASIMSKMPDRLPRCDIRLSPVSANGVALTPDWTLDGAQISRSATRMRICLNGLWAIQPGADTGGVPKDSDWAFFKVPGFLRKDIYSVYGQEKTSWADTDIYSAGTPLWFVRDVDVPAVSVPSSIFVDIPGMYSYAIKVYWNGRAAGTLTNQHGGKIDVTAFARPGEKGQLAIFAVPVKTEHLYAFKPDLVRMYRPQAGQQSGFLDTYLSIEPKRSYLGLVRLSPSVRRQSLRIETGVLPADERITCKLRVTTADGTVALEQDLGSGKANGRLQSFVTQWQAPRLWNPDDPYLYTAMVQAFDGERLIDESLPVKFGFREVWTDGRQLMLNGNPLHLRPRLWIEYFQDGKSLRRAISLFKDMGFNCIIRPSSATTDHEEDMNRWSRDEYYGITDEMGMLILSYTAYSCVSGGQFGDNTIAGEDVEKLVDYVVRHQIDPLYNHPSVIAYSGFGDQPTKGMNYLYLNPEIWGIAPLDQERFLSRLNNDSLLRDRILVKAKQGRRFIGGIKQADPTRPFLSHSDTGLGDGWGIFDYFNWTPVQEWEDWPATWSREGIMPVGSTEHGMPYFASFLNHALANGGDCEPWVTEYAASALGAGAYAKESREYLDFVRRSYVPASQNYTTLGGHGKAGDLTATAAANFHGVWVRNNKAIYRAWRTYGVPLGIEPFGPCNQFFNEREIAKDHGKVLADPSVNLKTPGAKLDRWSYYGGFWPAEAVLSYPEKPTGKAPPFLNSAGQMLRENNSPLLAYIAGSADQFSEKDHVFWSGERVRKQIAVVWDGFSPRSLKAQYKVRLGEKQISEGTSALSLTPGQIVMAPFEFAAPAVQDRADGVIELVISDTSGIVATDRFPFSVYEPYKASDRELAARIALFDPAGESAAMFQRLGLKVRNVKDVNQTPACDVLVIGRRALGKLSDGQWLGRLPRGVPVLVLEQTDADLQAIGLRSYPIRARQAFVLPHGSAALKGIEEADLANWRVTPTLLPAGSEPLRENYNYHTNYRGTIASVTIETPTVGNFTPHMQSGFDLRETALLETACGGHRILFCQLSLPEGAGIDPVATRIASNILDDLLSTPARTIRPLAVVGGDKPSALAADLGANGANGVAPENLVPGGLALVEKLPSDRKALTQWVRRGGTAVVMPQDVAEYAKAFPEIRTSSRETSLVAMGDWAKTPLLRGIGQNNLHSRQAIAQIIFNDQANVIEVTAGQGRWILLGFDPRKLDVAAMPYMRLTERQQYRLLSQILTNLDVDLSLPARGMFDRIGTGSKRLDITGLWRVSATSSAGAAWNDPAFDDSRWSTFDLQTQVTLGDACLRVRFPAIRQVSTPLVLTIESVGDFDETYINGAKIGEITPKNAQPDKAHAIRRVYAIPEGLLRSDKDNVLAMHAWNRNAAIGWLARLRGPVSIGPAEESNPASPYYGPYKPSDDPYLQMHW